LIRIVTPEVSLGWLLEDRDLPGDTEFLAADDRRIRGWCRVADVEQAFRSGVSFVEDLDLRPCEVRGEPNRPTLVQCGRSVLVLQPDAAGNPPDNPADPLAIGWQTLLGGVSQTAWTPDAHDAELRESYLGPLPLPQPVRLARPCRFNGCGYLAYLPPSPVPCPNRSVPRHDFA
jgi:hypothetical protein